jgi:hypothetical protein
LLGFLANQFARLVQVLLTGVGLILLVALSADLRGDFQSGSVLLVMTLWFVFSVLGIAVHELGHYAFARLMGMRVTHVQVGCFECAPQSRGIRVRISKSRRPGYAGHVIAFADPSRSIRAAHLVMTAGGATANFIAAGVFGLAGTLWTGAIPILCLMFATTNLVLGMINLVPHRGKVPNDGYLLVRLLRRAPDMLQHPYLRLVRLSLFGRTADQLPEEDLAAMERKVFPGPLVALWYRLKARQNLGDWPGAAAMQGDLDTLLEDRSAAECAPIRPLIDCIRTEMAFSSAMHMRASTPLTDDLLPESSAWYAPHLWPRCQALKAVIEGNIPACRRWLERASALADNSVDASLPISERMIGACLADMTQEVGASP